MDSPTMWTSSQVSAIKEEEEKDMSSIKVEEEKDMSAIKEEEEDRDMIMSLKRKDPSPQEEEEPKSDMKLSNNNKKKKQHLEDEDDHCYHYDEWNKEEKKHYEDEKAHYYEYDEDEEHDGIWFPVPSFSSHLPEEKKKHIRRSLRDDMRELINNPPVNHYDPFEYMEDTELMTVEQAKSYYKCAMDSLNGLTIDLDQVLVKEDGWGD